MSGYSTVNYEDVAPISDAMHFLRDPLDADNLGLTVIDVDGEWEGKPHDHADGGHEEVYLLFDGAATLTVDGEALDLDPGEAVRVDPASTRQLRIRDGGTVVVAGAP